MLSEFFFQLQPNHLNRGIEVRCSSRGDRAVQLQRTGFAEFVRERQVSLRKNENDDIDNCLLSCHDASPPLGMAQWDLQLSPPGWTMERAPTEAELCSFRREEDIQTREENELEMNWWLEEDLWGEDKSSTTSSSSLKQSKKRKRKETKQQSNKKKTKKRHSKKKKRQDLPRTEFDIYQSCPLLKEAHAAITDMNSTFHQERAWANVLASAPVAPHPKDRLAKEHNFVTSILENLRQRSSCRSVLAQVHSPSFCIPPSGKSDSNRMYEKALGVNSRRLSISTFSMYYVCCCKRILTSCSILSLLFFSFLHRSSICFEGTDGLSSLCLVFHIHFFFCNKKPKGCWRRQRKWVRQDIWAYQHRFKTIGGVAAIQKVCSCDSFSAFFSSHSETITTRTTRFAELHERLREYKRAVKNEYKLLKQKLQKDRRQLQQLRSTRPNTKTKLPVTCTLKGDTLS
ncbi:hypothetical protein QOT17_014710 [Balamuthia mandrillaris]